MTVGTRTWPRTVCIAWSCSRMGRVIHSAQDRGVKRGAWSVKATPVVTNGLLRVDDPDAGNYPQRFYRVLEH